MSSLTMSDLPSYKSNTGIYSAPSLAGYLFVWSERPDLSERFGQMAVEAGLKPHLLTDAAVRLYKTVDAGILPDYVQSLFTAEEQKQIKILLCDTEKPNLSEFGAVLTLEYFCREISSRWLRELLAEERVKSLMQPIVVGSASPDIHVHGYEFLLRGVTREGEEIPAPVMFKAGGDAGALGLLDLAAGQQAARKAQSCNLNTKIFVNILPSSLTEPGALDRWLDILVAEMPAIAGQLVFEVVESQQFESAQQLGDLSRELSKRGIEMAMDDFGTGFNNLSTLTTVRPDYIKLDKSLIVGLAQDPGKWNMVANIVDTAKQANVKVVGEGVEDLETATALTSVGVDFLQGYYFGYPKDTPIGLTRDVGAHGAAADAISEAATW